MKKLRWEIIVLLCVVMLSGRVHAAISISANLTGPTTVYEGAGNSFNYSWLLTEDTAGDHSHDGIIRWNAGDGSSTTTSSAYQFNGSAYRYLTYQDDGSYTLTVTSDQAINVSSYHSSSFGGSYHNYYGSINHPTKTLSVNVLNVAPTIQSITTDLTIDAGVGFSFLGTATDPGVNDVLTYAWDLDNDGAYDDASGASGLHSFAAEGLYNVGLRVADGDGGFDYDSFEVNVIPEPATLGLMAFTSLGLFFRRRRRINKCMLTGVVMKKRESFELDRKTKENPVDGTGYVCPVPTRLRSHSRKSQRMNHF